MKHLYIIFLLFTFFLSVSCNPIKSRLSLNKKNFNLIKEDSLIMQELKLSLNDSIDVNLINRRLDSFFLKKHTKDELISSIELDRVFKGKSIEIDRSVTVDSALNFDDIPALKAYLKEVKRDFNNIKIIDSSKVD